MKVTKAVITAAGRKQRTLPLQILIDRDGVEKSVLRIILEEVMRAGIDEICLVVCPGDEQRYAEVAGDQARPAALCATDTGARSRPCRLLRQGFCRTCPFFTPGRRSLVCQPQRARLRPTVGGSGRGRGVYRVGRASDA